MSPTLNVPDVLEIEPCVGSALRCGDVVVFISPESGINVVHRVMSVGNCSVKTRGDNNNEPDSYDVPFEHVMGRVVAAGQGRKRRSIHSGTAGRFFGGLARVRQAASRYASRLLHGPYHWLARTQILTRILPRTMKPHTVCFSRPDGAVLQLFIGKRAIGRLDSDSRVWRIDRPFRLFIDESTLPYGEDETRKICTTED